MKKKSPHILYLFAIISVTIALVFFGKAVHSSFAQQSLVCPTPAKNGQPELQLVTCYLVSPTPSPTQAITNALPILNFQLPIPSGNPSQNSNPSSGPTCQSDSIVSSSCTCPSYEEEDTICYDPTCKADGGDILDSGDLDSTKGIPQGANCSFGPETKPKCNGSTALEWNSKPVIYLYPSVPTKVTVQLGMEGHVTVSDPLYTNGWNNIEAYPDGTLLYKHKYYHELYYESATVKVTPMKRGMFIPTNALQSNLNEIAIKLGLNTAERNEFVGYWVPRLSSLHAPYILFSLFPPDEKAKVDTVNISPKPDVFIGFLAYFKPVDHPYALAPLQFPAVPQRTGFTAVEWGGTVDE